MASIRQEQIAELIKRHFSMVIMEKGGYIYGSEVLVTVTNVQLSPDISSAKIYLSVYNTENKQAVILLMEEENAQLRHALSKRLKNKLRRVPVLDFYLDDTLDEMYKVNQLLDGIE